MVSLIFVFEAFIEHNADNYLRRTCEYTAHNKLMSLIPARGGRKLNRPPSFFLSFVGAVVLGSVPLNTMQFPDQSRAMYV